MPLVLLVMTGIRWIQAPVPVSLHVQKRNLRLQTLQVLMLPKTKGLTLTIPLLIPAIRLRISLALPVITVQKTDVKLISPPQNSAVLPTVRPATVPGYVSTAPTDALLAPEIPAWTAALVIMLSVKTLKVFHAPLDSTWIPQRNSAKNVLTDVPNVPAQQIVPLAQTGVFRSKDCVLSSLTMKELLMMKEFLISIVISVIISRATFAKSAPWKDADSVPTRIHARFAMQVIRFQTASAK